MKKNDKKRDFKISALFKNDFILFVFFSFSIIYFEGILKLFCNQAPFMIYTVLIFSFSLSFLAVLVGTITGNKKIDAIISEILILFLSLIFITELLLQKSFSVFMGVTTIGANGADAATEFTSEIMAMIINCAVPIILFLIPPIVLCFLIKKIFKEKKVIWKRKIILVVLMAVFHALGVFSVKFQNTVPVSGYEYYTSYYSFNEVVPRVGLLTALRLDIKYAIFGIPEEKFENTFIHINENQSGENNNTAASQGDYKPNIDPAYNFSELAKNSKSSTIKNMAEYFDSVIPTMKNEYTGIFEGKNLIFITAEAFHTIAMSEELTPTLWKMAHEGFVLKEYYQPTWGGGTVIGEYANLFGLYPNGARAMMDTRDQDISYTIGNRLLKKGYTGLAFHNGKSTYYKRNLTHPGLGYEKYLANDNGLYKGFKFDNKWSDEQMMEASLPMYIDKDPFSVYYMTVSAHAKYDKQSNGGLARKNFNRVEHLPYSETLKCYIAKNLELEDALKFLTDSLEDAGKLDDTVFVIAPDHFPYGLGWDGKEYLSEMARKNDYNYNFDLTRTTGIIYCASMESPVIIDKPSYSLDIYPTLMNLFGLTYDSRIFTGQDLLSESLGLVIFPDYSWISDKCYYDYQSKKAEPRNGAVIDDDYVKKMSQYVKIKMQIGRKVQENDFFGVINNNNK